METVFGLSSHSGTLRSMSNVIQVTLNAPSHLESTLILPSGTSEYMQCCAALARSTYKEAFAVKG